MVVLMKHGTSATNTEYYEKIVNDKATIIEMDGYRISVINECIICGKKNLQSIQPDVEVIGFNDRFRKRVIESAVEHFNNHGCSFDTDDQCRNLMVFYW